MSIDKVSWIPSSIQINNAEYVGVRPYGTLRIDSERNELKSMQQLLSKKDDK